MKPILNKNDVEINIKKAKKILENGDLVIFPTETVYGLGGNAIDENAIKKIYKIKNRPSNNPLICHFKNIDSIEKDFVINDKSYELANQFWPGPLTLILEKKETSNISPILSNHKKFVACRIPKHPTAQKLLQNLEFPIAAPSANISTKLSSTRIIHLSKKLKDNIFLLDGGKSFYGLESTIINACNGNPKILRLGSITLEVIEKIIPNIILENHSNFLHILDNSQSIGIAVAPVPDHNLGKTINDRLTRASKS